MPSLQKVEVEAGDDVGGGVHVIVGGAGGLGAAWAARLTGTVLVAGRRRERSPLHYNAITTFNATSRTNKTS